MAPRRYNRHRRDEALAATRRCIVEATVALHAEHGASRTTYAMIAKRADVAIPTVYKHFPDLAALLGACTSHTASRAPALSDDLLAGLADTPARLRALVGALFARHRALSPWLRWGQHEAALMPELGAIADRWRDADARFIRAALAPRFGAAPPAPAVGLVEILTRYAAWETLTQTHGLSQDEAVRAASGALDALVAAPGAEPHSKPRRRA